MYPLNHLIQHIQTMVKLFKGLHAEFFRESQRDILLFYRIKELGNLCVCLIDMSYSIIGLQYQDGQCQNVKKLRLSLDKKSCRQGRNGYKADPQTSLKREIFTHHY